MLIVRFLGLLDILGALALFFSTRGLYEPFAIIMGILLILKGLFYFSLISTVDIIAGLLLLFSAVFSYPLLSWIFILWLLQKGFFSFFS